MSGQTRERGCRVMKDCKKLFQRDKTFFMWLEGIVVLILIFGLLKYYEGMKVEKELYELYLENGFWSKAEFDVYVPGEWQLWIVDFYSDIAQIIFLVVIAAQIIKWNVLESRNGKEFQFLLPVKSQSYITYDLICGVLLVWVPLFLTACGQMIAIDKTLHYDLAAHWGNVGGKMLEYIAAYSLIYCLIVFARKISNHMPGALFAAFVIWATPTIAAILFGDAGLQQLCTFDFGTAKGKTEQLLIYLSITIAFILLSYWCDGKRDHAGTGVYAFRTARYLMIAASFADLALIFYEGLPIYGNLLGALRIAVAVLLAGVIAVGINYLIKPAAYKA